VRHHAGVSSGRRRIQPRRLFVSLLVVAGLFLIAYGFASATTGDKAVEITDPAIERVDPLPGAEQVGVHQTITADLAPGYRGILIVNGQEIGVIDDFNTGTTSSAAAYDTRYDPALNTLTYTPQEGATVPNLQPGARNTVTLLFWQITQSRDYARTFSWSFKVT